MLPRLAFLLAGLVLAGTMPAAGAPGDCIATPEKHQFLRFDNGQYLYVKHPTDATKTDVSHIGIWDETNGREDLQVEDCHLASGPVSYKADRQAAGLPLV